MKRQYKKEMDPIIVDITDPKTDIEQLYFVFKKYKQGLTYRKDPNGLVRTDANGLILDDSSLDRPGPVWQSRAGSFYKWDIIHWIDPPPRTKTMSVKQVHDLAMLLLSAWLQGGLIKNLDEGKDIDGGIVGTWYQFLK
jgi:hypothetical protein